MQSGISGIAVVTYRTAPSSWFFAEVDGTWIYRFGPFSSAKALDDVLTVIYATPPQRAAIAPVGECDDAVVLLAAAALAAPSPPGRRMPASAGTVTGWRTLLHRLHFRGAPEIVIH
ncbi:hypothetical protein AB4Z48_38315 [Cupriavidus sp. 2TAF22]|uniref:hypothetical protein n=1 Tax=unclassified Cupriavidus TaxID=2640874 RepID=UPI003F90E149